MKRLLFSAPHEFFPDDLRTKLQSKFEVDFVYGEPLDVQLQRLRDKHAWVVSTAPERFLGRDAIDCGKKLEVVATPSTGWTHLDVDYLAQRSIKFISLRGSHTIDQIKASSEHTFLLILAMLRKVPLAMGHVQAGYWRARESELHGREAFGKTLGVIGYGRIGRNVCHYGNAFGLTTLAFDPYASSYADYVRRCEELPDLLRTSDIVCVCAHLNESTQRLIGEREFALMKSGAWFVNTSRGEIVDEAALLDALASEHLAGAALDVLDHELDTSGLDNPLIDYSRKNQNLIITPHVAGLTAESETKAATEIIGKLVAEFSSEGSDR